MKGRKKRIAIWTLPLILLLTLIQACSSERRYDLTMGLSKQNITEAPTLKPIQEPMLTPATTAKASLSGNSEDLFLYDSLKPLNVKEIRVEETTTGVKVTEKSYDVYDKTKNSEGKSSAYLVMPKGEGPFPCVLYFHWLGKNNSNKDEFLEEAKALADKGIAGILIDGYFPWKKAPRELDKDKAMVIYQVIELRRMIDYISSLPNVDSERIGFVGHDYGAMFGAVLSGIDNRISNYIFITGMGNFTDWFLQYWVPLDKDQKEKYRLEMSELDPVNYIKNAAPANIFFQFANNDSFISEEHADEFYEASSQPKEVKFYDARHEMESEEAMTDRQQWLIEKLK